MKLQKLFLLKIYFQSINVNFQISNLASINVIGQYLQEFYNFVTYLNTRFFEYDGKIIPPDFLIESSKIIISVDLLELIIICYFNEFLYDF